MEQVKIHTLLPRSVLSSRDSARSIATDVVDAVRRATDGLELDLKDVLGMAPSFFDELLTIIDEASEFLGNPTPRIVLSHTPSPLAEKHHAVCRGHGLSISENEEGDWLLTQAHQ